MTAVATDKRLTLNAQLRANEPQASSTEETESNDNAQDEVISGYAIVFNEMSKDLDGFQEIIKPTALDGVDLSNVYLLNEHDYSQVLASVKAGTLELTVDSKGLAFKATLANTSYANDVYEQIKEGNVNTCSFGFDTDDVTDDWAEDENGVVTRTINQIKNLYDVSIVAVPAYNGANVSVDTRSYERFMTQKGEKEKMTQKEIIKPKVNEETRSFENFIRSHGETRDGLKTSGASAVIPNEIITPVFQLKQSQFSLAKLATVKTVSNGTGHYPIATADQSTTLATKEELAKMEDKEANMFKDVPFNVETRAGKIALSNEVVEDSAVDIVAEVKAQLQKLVDNTDNNKILELLNGKDFTEVPAKNIDDLKKIKDVSLDPSLSLTWIMNQTAFYKLDTMKDSNGRYLLQPDVTADSGYNLLGYPITKVSNKLLPDNSDGTSPMYLGDLEQAIVIFRRNQVTAQWDEFDQFSQGLSVVVRNDYEHIDPTAAVRIKFGDTGK